MPTETKAQKKFFGAIRKYQQDQEKKANLQNYITDVQKGPGKKLKTVNREVPMKKEAFERGFIKAATDKGISPIVAYGMLKQSGALDSLMAPGNWAMAHNAAQQAVPADAAAGGIGGAGLGALAGGGLGAMTGAMSGRDDKHPENNHALRNAMLLGLLGAGVGGAGGGLAGFAGGGLYGESKVHDIDNKFMQSQGK